MIRDEWDSYRRHVLPAHCPPVQFQETRRAFYAGCQAMLTLAAQVGQVAASEDQGAAMLDALEQELRQFARAVLEGRS